MSDVDRCHRCGKTSTDLPIWQDPFCPPVRLCRPHWNDANFLGGYFLAGEKPSVDGGWDADGIWCHH